mmetsp:Transcript_28564/g.32651  ORF Transcript_28564/g.32651 Transcript_28564/m.32651 type:complete len:161 (-) Transcript_28564:26-508(-)|eukprot:CAMPEP_0168337048 /NCGR_PEP_ID=MMETSP0213-20121227/11923_1 /TAXON_ID=151035 /ORGANISM="Euplotes harpa, Strain FSP1.4" /LENGTH=160 /DNA_ID=CAMNT_0008342393 /DNA_START=3 /DNA_END=485 /DNA_ORIENTATION=+
MNEYPALSYFAYHNYPRIKNTDLADIPGSPLSSLPRVDYFLNPLYFAQAQMDEYWDSQHQLQREAFARQVYSQIQREKFDSKQSIKNLRDKIRESTRKSKQIQQEIGTEYREYKILKKRQEEEQTIAKENEYLREKLEEIKMDQLNKASSQLYLTSSLLD